MSRSILFFLIFNLFYFYSVPSIFAQTNTEDVTQINAAGYIDDEETIGLSFEEELAKFYEILKEKEKQKQRLLERLSVEKDVLTRQQLTQELASVDDVIIGVRNEVVNISTNGMTLFAKPPVDKKAFNWKQDLEVIFEPLLAQLRGLGEQPRLIAKLEADIVYWESREKALTQAVDNLNENFKKLTKPVLMQEVKNLLDSAVSRKNTAQQKLSLLNKDLKDLQQSQSTVWTSLGDIFKGVIVGILLHFMAAVAAAVFVYQCVRILSLIPIKLIRQKKSNTKLFAERAVVFGRIIIGIIFMMLTYFIVLYSLNEWLLMVLSLLIIAGIILALKNTVPAYILEIKALLNMGSIRQGERLIYNGLPWRISKLNVHTHLSNPALGGSLRVPLSEIINQSSRDAHANEPWFPTSVGDIVILEDGVFGKVVLQTLDVVEIDLGGSIFTYLTLNFLSKRPQNLSKEGFSIFENFGFDYQHQSIATTEMLKIYKDELIMAMKLSDYNDFNTFLTVEFSNASASSLDFRIVASFKGDIASDYYRLKRFIQQSSVNIANKHGWIIPFQQITVHHLPES